MTNEELRALIDSYEESRRPLVKRVAELRTQLRGVGNEKDNAAYKASKRILLLYMEIGEMNQTIAILKKKLAQQSGEGLKTSLGRDVERRAGVLGGRKL